MKIPSHAVIVGGTKGLGKEVTRCFLERGCKVSVLSRNGSNDLPSNPNLQTIKTDLEKLTDAKQLVSEVIDQAGPINYLIFCQRYRGAQDVWQGEMQVSLIATDLIIKACADNFVKDGDKAIAIVSSVYADFVGGSQPVSYHVAKAGLNQLVKYYAWQLGKKGIRTNSIMPLTYIKPATHDYYTSNTQLMNLYKEFVPLQRMGNAKDSVNAIDFLCSEKASFINGQNIFIDGGVSVVWPEELAQSLKLAKSTEECD